MFRSSSAWCLLQTTSCFVGRNFNWITQMHSWLYLSFCLKRTSFETSDYGDTICKSMTCYGYCVCRFEVFNQKENSKLWCKLQKWNDALMISDYHHIFLLWCQSFLDLKWIREESPKSIALDYRDQQHLPLSRFRKKSLDTVFPQKIVRYEVAQALRRPLFESSLFWCQCHFRSDACKEFQWWTARFP